MLPSTPTEPPEVEGLRLYDFLQHILDATDRCQRHTAGMDEGAFSSAVKHGYGHRAIEWPFCSFHYYVRRGWLPEDWGVQLLGQVQADPELHPEADLLVSLTEGLHGEVAAMNTDNFIERLHLEVMERFQQRDAWEDLIDSDRETLQREVARLPSEIATDDIESRLFDLTALRMQLALAEGDQGVFERHRKRVVEIAMLVEEKATIPAVATEFGYLASVRESAFWEGIDLKQLQELRLRGLVPFLARKARKIVYTDFKDEVLGVRKETPVAVPKMMGAQLERGFERESERFFFFV